MINRFTQKAQGALQFTLQAATRKGNRPSYIAAAGDQGKEHFGMIYLKMPVERLNLRRIYCFGELQGGYAEIYPKRTIFTGQII